VGNSILQYKRNTFKWSTAEILTRRLEGTYEIYCYCFGCFSQRSKKFNYSIFIKLRRKWKRPARHERSILNVICNVGDLIAVMKTQVFWDFIPCILVTNLRSFEGTTILRILSLSKWRYVNIKHIGCKIQRYKNHSGYFGVEDIYIYIYIFVYLCVCVCVCVCLCMCINSHTELSYIFRQWASNPLSVKENAQSCYMLQFFTE
jgi:hypothetical protein